MLDQNQGKTRVTYTKCVRETQFGSYSIVIEHLVSSLLLTLQTTETKIKSTFQMVEPILR